MDEDKSICTFARRLWSICMLSCQKTQLTTCFITKFSVWFLFEFGSIFSAPAWIKFYLCVWDGFIQNRSKLFLKLLVSKSLSIQFDVWNLDQFCKCSLSLLHSRYTLRSILIFNVTGYSRKHLRTKVFVPNSSSACT